jgi:hypothetical protein
MIVNWADLGEVFAATLVSVVCLVVLFSYGVRGLSRQTTAREQGGAGTAPFVGAVVCFALCVAIVGYGIYLIVVKP